MLIGCGPSNMTDADAEFLIMQGGQMYSNAIGRNQQTFNSSMTLYDNRGAIVGTLDAILIEHGWLCASRQETGGKPLETFLINPKINVKGEWDTFCQ